MIDCPRCNGSGQTQFTHIKGGVCFRCYGLGSDVHAELLKAQQAVTKLRGLWRNAPKGQRAEIEQKGLAARRAADKIQRMIDGGKARLLSL